MHNTNPCASDASGNCDTMCIRMCFCVRIQAISQWRHRPFSLPSFRRLQRQGSGTRSRFNISGNNRARILVQPRNVRNATSSSGDAHMIKQSDTTEMEQTDQAYASNRLRMLPSSISFLKVATACVTAFNGAVVIQHPATRRPLMQAANIQFHRAMPCCVLQSSTNVLIKSDLFSN